jgi:hypothetical protein
MSKSLSRSAVISVVMVACAMYVPGILWKDAPFYQALLPAPRLRFLGWSGKMIWLGLATVYCLLSASRFEKREPARVAWTLFGISLALWWVGYVNIGLYAFVWNDSMPCPTGGDAAFLLGYGIMLAALVRFIFIYRSTGLPMGSGRQHLLLAAGATFLVAIASWVLLAPIARSEEPWVARFINVAYPLLDLLALVPTVVLLRIAFAFRPGQVWKVWAALLLSFALTAVGDAISSYLWPSPATATDPTTHLMYLLAYFAVALGTRSQYKLLTRAQAIDAPSVRALA